MNRDFNSEYQDAQRKYAYDFDTVLRRYMFRVLGPFFRPGPALEMGCFEGEVTAMLLERFPDLTVVEASSDLAAVAAKRVGGSVRFVNAMFEDAAFETRFESIFLIHGLEHVDDAVAVLSRVNDWLSPTGRLFLVVPNANAPSRQIAVQMGMISHNAAVTDAERAHGHRRTYSLDTLGRDAAAAGLKEIHRGGVFFKPLANFQFDRLMGGDLITDGYLEGCYRLGMHYPDLCASVYLVCEKGGPR
jgi:SAM-dependent methyltransferase